jgi:hypothetical protein
MYCLKTNRANSKRVIMRGFQTRAGRAALIIADESGRMALARYGSLEPAEPAGPAGRRGDDCG